MIDLSKKKYFLFDMDGTLIDLEQLNYNCFKDAVKKSCSRDLSFEEYMQYMAGVGSKHGFENYFQSVNVQIPDVDEVVKGYRAQKEFYLQNHFDEVVTIKEGAKEFLAKAKSLGKKLAIGTSTFKGFAYLIIEKSGLKEYFDSIVTVDDVQKTKPAPDIFFEALKRLDGTVNEAVIFEDSGNGVKSAENSGIEFYVVRNPGKNDAVVASHENCITTYTELLPKLAILSHD